mmetsp:Transcript_15316/g.36509  ORF Transcript_15316/g.36509 Transcript_15316/m.36509 type:complete len:242 (-) Transcript_15316:533-1258(-)
MGDCRAAEPARGRRGAVFRCRGRGRRARAGRQGGRQMAGQAAGAAAHAGRQARRQRRQPGPADRPDGRHAGPGAGRGALARPHRQRQGRAHAGGRHQQAGRAAAHGRLPRHDDLQDRLGGACQGPGGLPVGRRGAHGHARLGLCRQQDGVRVRHADRDALRAPLSARQITFASRSGQPSSRRCGVSASISGASSPATSRAIEWPTAGACCMPWPEKPQAVNALAQPGSRPARPLWSKLFIS